MCANDSVRFARYCGKMYSRHLFPYGGLKSDKLKIRGAFSSICTENPVIPVGNEMELEIFRKKGTQLFLFSRFYRNYRKITAPFVSSH